MGGRNNVAAISILERHVIQRWRATVPGVEEPIERAAHALAQTTPTGWLRLPTSAPRLPTTWRWTSCAAAWAGRQQTCCSSIALSQGGAGACAAGHHWREGGDAAYRPINTAYQAYASLPCSGAFNGKAKDVGGYSCMNGGANGLRL